MLSKFKSGHRKEIEKKIKQNHFELFENSDNYLIKYFNILSKRENWWLVFLNVVILYILVAAINLDFTFIKIDKDTASTIIDQRTSNVATIISMTLAVIGLLLSNLAVKNDQTYKLLFVNSRLYLIIYYTLSAIFCLIIVSTLRDSIEPYFERFVLAGTYLALIILIGIGYLFSTIINFANASNIQKILKQKLIDEIKMNVKIFLLSKYSAAEFKNLMHDHGIDPVGLRQRLLLPDLDRPPTEEYLIYDIDFKDLQDRLKNRHAYEKYYYVESLSLNLVTQNHSNFIFPGITTSYNRQLDLSGCLTLKKPSKIINQSDEYVRYFETKLEEYTTEGKQKNINEILSIYDELFDLLLKHDIV
ncbi:Uncharacterised protein [Chryseobacterium nakagawai]|uniref:Uncharacterized protein n=1 Tax=Chryseobacterium nakagawai TaxID=1241982 RepID=A0AAD1DPR9_CHRNA|nr:hypothetical protein [Chryseobacterium nakagawai]AZA89660.1 hypothetical protein EG343_02945 [Chryseobacterium nakagawai]VEH21041.1 Uncharacterised protein [Chryseobacterium nakagawai]